MTALDLKVTEIAEAAELIRAVTLEAPDGSPLPAYDPGAHVDVHLPDGTTRSYSLIDWDGGAAAPAAYRFGIRLEAESTGGSRYMHGLSEGDTVAVEGPSNDFPLAGGDAPSVLIAGGIGITPIVSMATALKARGAPYALHYAVRSEAAAAFADRLAEAHGDALSMHHDDRAGGPLDVAGIVKAADPSAHVYVCGPKAMIKAVKAAAEAEGYPAEQIHFELFDAPADQDGDTAFEVELASSGEVYTIPPGRTIIEVLEEAGEDLIYDCQRGDCGICQTDVLEGEPDHRDVVLSSEERASNKVMQICVSRAKSARLKLDL
ncbi:PDR/VanB family oxidoreductase [Roseivivax sediminis]|uniref:Vanillate O-demethylase ferredoxin subunit n=1 Tax=Roseivivax sediminis TaxID=936889 RepID=A0A1I1Z6F7_9RHOB|nr:PDR/VanB family oxidoreductase [Roseivivax sediminis]SFE27376.1 vanillate O-demethylase ferredoxin subunit [Roseivivax sediminis]